MQRRALVVLVGAVVALMIPSVSASAMPGSNPFTGVWTGNDTLPTDMSNLRLIITPSGQVTLIDDGATVCGVDAGGVPLVGGVFRGTATFSPSGAPTLMTVDYTNSHCRNGTDPGRLPRH